MNDKELIIIINDSRLFLLISVKKMIVHLTIIHKNGIIFNYIDPCVYHLEITRDSYFLHTFIDFHLHLLNKFSLHKISQYSLTLTPNVNVYDVHVYSETSPNYLLLHKKTYFVIILQLL